MEGCNQATITGAGLAHLVGITCLGMADCREETIAAALELGLPVATRLYTRYGPFDSSLVEREAEEEEHDDNEDSEGAEDDLELTRIVHTTVLASLEQAAEPRRAGAASLARSHRLLHLKA